MRSMTGVPSSRRSMPSLQTRTVQTDRQTDRHTDRQTPLRTSKHYLPHPLREVAGNNECMH